MTNCAKCGAELIGNKKFCAACGTPVTDPRTTGSSPGGAPGAPSAAYGGAPSSQVNPFAATAFPGGKKEERPSLYGPPPELKAPVPAAGMPPLPAEASQMTGPSSTGQVSPLAVSNALSQRPAEVQSAVNAAAHSVRPASVAAQRPPGTAQMPSVPKQAVAAPPAPAGGKKGGTQMMSPVSYAQAQAQKQQAPASVVAAPSPPAPPAAPSSSGASPAQPAAPAAQVINSPVPFPAPQQPPYSASPYNAPMPGQAPITPQNPWSSQQPWSGPAQQPYGGYGGATFGYTPGTHVMVTWANGQRYPGTIHHVQGTRCLVVFPDGQQHWVEMQYIAPV